MTLTTLQYLRDRDTARDAIERAIAYAAEQSILFWLHYARLFRGWLMLEEGRSSEAVSTLREALAAHRAAGSEVHVPHMMVVLAQALLRTGAFEEAFDVLDAALEQIQRGGERHYEAEAHRVKGDLLAAGRRNDPEAAEKAYMRAVAVAEGQEAKLFELRASASLAQFWHQHGRTEDAGELLEGIYAWFSEGFDEKDLKEAQATLREIRPQRQ
jgi:predicted ATPase